MSLPNVSVISVAQVNDTVMTTHNTTAQNQTAALNQSRLAAVLETDDPIDSLDITGAKAAMFLDGCKVKGNP